MGIEAPVSFRQPPVVETVLGVQFARLPSLTNAHLGAFWQHLGAGWLNVRDTPQLEEQFETFGEAAAWGGVQLKLTQSPSLRLQIKNAAEDRMIQVQNGRFHYNWLGHGGEDYPRYKQVRPEFDGALSDFRRFLEKQHAGAIEPNQWEVTYVNHMPKGTVWDEPDDWLKLFNRLPGPCLGSDSLKLEGLGGLWHFEIVPQRGRLHVEIQHGRIGSPDGQEAIVMKLTARGPIAPGEPVELGVGRGLDLGHDAIVASFRDLTSPEAHKYWGEDS